MDHFNYKDGTMYAENVPIPKIALEVGTPFYCYSTATLTRHYQVFARAFAEIPTTICFAVKANSNIAVLKTLAKLGAGADTVSEGEIRRARAAGIAPEKIIFSGVGKTRDEMRYALGINILQFNVESAEELIVLNETATELGVIAKVALRVNPDIDAGTHDKISTGRKTDKFGIAWESVVNIYEMAKLMSGIEITGVTTHIGSQLTDLQPFKEAFERIKGLVKTLRENGHIIKFLDLGGGLGIPYGSENPPHPTEYAAMIIDTIHDLDCELILEPGRLIAGNAGILVSKVILTKNTPDRTFVIVDAAMNDLLRPSLYDAYHEILPVTKSSADTVMEKVDIVGPVCETADTFGKQRLLPHIEPDDLLVLRSAGAYGATMSSIYNSRLLIPEIMVNDSEFSVIRKRPAYDDMLATDKIPNWLE